MPNSNAGTDSHLSAAISIRPVAGHAEREAFFRLAAQTFIRDVPAEIGGADWLRFVTAHPRLRPENVRGAFRGNTYLGGYIVEERWLCMGTGRVRAGCIGAVVTHPEHRRQGIGRALMRDAIDYARARGLALLLLNGAAHFYDPYGFIDIFDRAQHAVACADIRAQPPSRYRVRPASGADAPALLALYQRHYGPYTGSYARSLDEQAYTVRFAETVAQSEYVWRGDVSFAPPVLAVDGDGTPRGYLAVPWGPIRSFGCEVAADDWPATLALLQHHAARLGELAEPPDHVRWPLPPTSAAFYALADHLPVRTETDQRPHAGWMASIVAVPALIRSVLPEWQARRQRSSPSWTGTLEVAVEEEVLGLEVDRAGIRLLDRASAGAIKVRLGRSALTQLLFGYRPVSWALGRADAQVPPDLAPLLDVLFTASPAWIAPTDGC